MPQPSYIALYHSGELAERAAILHDRLFNCDICPRACHINRIAGEKGFCRSDSQIYISSYCDHHGEEPVLSGSRGSGTIFFTGCNLKCVFCQNYQISQLPDNKQKGLSTAELASIMLYLQDKLCCHNINLVSPSHFVPQIVEALLTAVPLGLRIPLVYNTNAYDSPDTLRLLENIVDIYLPDIKYSSDNWAVRFSHAVNYVDTSRMAIKEMYRQVGELVTDGNIAVKGLIVRHLILPNGIAGSADSLKWLLENTSRHISVSIMAQYYPAYLAINEPLLSRKINRTEFDEVVELLKELNMENGWLQEMESADFYLPDFNSHGHPFQK